MMHLAIPQTEGKQNNTTPNKPASASFVRSAATDRSWKALVVPSIVALNARIVKLGIASVIEALQPDAITIPDRFLLFAYDCASCVPNSRKLCIISVPYAERNDSG